MSFSDTHPTLYRVIRTFIQAAVGVLAAAIAQAAGIVDDINWQAVIVLAVSTGLAAVMNLPQKELDIPAEETDTDEEPEDEVDAED